MKQNLRMQLQLLLKRKEFYLSLTLLIILSIIAFVLECIVYNNMDVSELRAADMLFFLRAYNYTFHGIIITIYPILIILPFADSYITDRIVNVLPLIQTRTKATHYYLSKMIIVFFSAFLVILVPQLLNLLLNAITFPASTIGDFTNGQYGYNYVFALSEFAFPYLFDSNPNLYNLVFVAVFSFTGGIIAVLIYTLSYFLKKSRLFIICLYFLFSHLLMLSNIWINLPVDIDLNTYLFACNASLTKSYFVYWGYIILFLVAIAILSKITISNLRKRNI